MVRGSNSNSNNNSSGDGGLAAAGVIPLDAAELAARLKDPVFAVYREGLALRASRGGSGAAVASAALIEFDTPDGRARAVARPAYARIDAVLGALYARAHALGAECDGLQAALLACPDAQLAALQRASDARLAELAATYGRLVALHTYARVVQQDAPCAALAKMRGARDAALVARAKAGPAGFDAATAQAAQAGRADDVWPDRVNYVVLAAPRIARDDTLQARQKKARAARQTQRVARRLARAATATAK